MIDIQTSSVPIQGPYCWPVVLVLFLGWLIGTMGAIGKDYSDYMSTESEQEPPHGTKSKVAYPKHRAVARAALAGVAIGCVPLFLSLSQSSLIDASKIDKLFVLLGFSCLGAFLPELFLMNVSQRVFEASKMAQRDARKANFKAEQAFDETERQSLRHRVYRYLEDGKYETMVDLCRKILIRYGRTPVDLANLGSALMYTLDPTDKLDLAHVNLVGFSEVFESLDEAIAMDPSYERAHYDRACAMNLQRRAAIHQNQTPIYSETDIVDRIRSAARLEPANWSLALEDADLVEVKDQIRKARTETN